MSKTFDIEGNKVTVYCNDHEIVDVDIDDDMIPVNFFSLRYDDRENGDDSISVRLPYAFENPYANIFTDGDPDEPSDDHFVTLSKSGEITLLPQEVEDVKKALDLYLKNEIFDMAIVRIDSFLF